MIRLCGVSKTYKSKSREQCHAIDNMTLNISDTGMVFVVGKSGSGKSTLLNLIGGLDNISGGSINVNGNELSAMSENELSNYRNTHIGFIFQDYHLIDSLTIYENIMLSLKLQHKADDNVVSDSLKKVDLAGYERRYANELSGGERQRIAIARALVKRPHIILADEPTGNLDSKNAVQIMELLKEISKDCLVLIVSHNNEDASNYADRIIRLESGRVVSDDIRNSLYNDELRINDSIIELPIRVYSDEEVNAVNASFDKAMGIRQKNNKFISNTGESVSDTRIDIQTKSLRFVDLFRLCISFLKNKVFNITFSSFMISCLFVILSIAQSLIAFNPSQILSEEMNKNNIDSFVLRKTNPNLVDNLLYNISDEEIEKFYETGYKGNIYPIYSLSLIANSGKFNTSIQKCVEYELSENKYATTSLGLVLCDKDYLVKKYGTNGNLRFLAGGEEGHRTGVIITDYFADTILASKTYQSANPNAKTYNDLIGYYLPSSTLVHGYINGIINTGYKDTHKEYFDFIEKNPDITYSNLATNQLYIDFYEDVFNNLALTYSFNKNFIQDEVEYNSRNFARSHKVYIDGKCDSSLSIISSIKMYKDIELADDEIYISMEIYNNIYGTNYTSKNINTFSPHDVTVKTYYYSDEKKENTLIEKTYKCVGLLPSSFCLIVNDKELKRYKELESIRYSMLFDDTGNISDIMAVGETLGYTQNSHLIDGIQTMNKAIEAFVPLFDLISIVLTIGAALILASFSYKMIKDKIHEIGILKSLGTKDNYISVIFGLQILLTAIMTCIFTFVGYILLVDVSNDILFESLIRLTTLHVVHLDFISFNIDVLIKNYLIIFALSFTVIVVPFIIIRTIKPVSIIRAKE